VSISVVHSNDAAAVAKNLVRIGKNLGRESWLNVPIAPAVVSRSKNSFLKVGSYGYSVSAELFARFLASTNGALLHIHGGHLWKFCLRTRLPYVLHIHGSDVRGFNSDGIPISRVSRGTMEAILKAKGVVFSTPELGPIVREIRADATWLPNPITPFPNPPALRDKRHSFADIFFPHEWMDDKGLQSGLSLIERIRSAAGRKLKIVGLKIGPRQDLALQNGIELVDPVARVKHFDRLLNSKVVLGQGHGALYSLNELEAMSIGANFIPVPLQDPARQAYGHTFSKASIKTLDESVDVALSFLGATPRTSSLNYDDILGLHSDSRIYEEISRIYRDLGSK